MSRAGDGGQGPEFGIAKALNARRHLIATSSIPSSRLGKRNTLLAVGSTPLSVSSNPARGKPAILRRNANLCRPVPLFPSTLRLTS